MAEALKEAPMATIPRPAGIITARIVPETGLVAPSGYNDAIFELFRENDMAQLQGQDGGSQFAGDVGGNTYDDEDIF